MENDPHLIRFMSYLSLFTFFMLILVTANNFVQMFVGWEGVGLCSYLLIGHWFKNNSFNYAARKAFIMAKGKEGLELKKEILLALGKTPIIKDQKLLIEPNEWFAEIGNEYPALEKEYLRLEPTKTLMNKRQIEGLASVRAHWLRMLVDVRTYLASPSQCISTLQ